MASATHLISGCAIGLQRNLNQFVSSVADMITVMNIHGSMTRLAICLCMPMSFRSWQRSTAWSRANNQAALARAFSSPSSSTAACMPAWFFPQKTGIAGSVMTRSINLLVGIARELAELREKTRWVISSAWTNRGYSSSHVVKRQPFGAIESFKILAWYMFTRKTYVN